MKIYRICQYYEEVMDEGVAEHGEHFDSALYFSIGQNEETQGDSVCWIYWADELLYTRGYTSHNASFPAIIRVAGGLDRIFRGWYDPIQKMISIVCPREPGDHEKKDIYDVPMSLYEALEKSFCKGCKMVVF
jgi:hypothetical protein